MFWDYEDNLQKEAANLLRVYDFEDILEINDLTLTDVLTMLIREGLIDLEFKDIS